MLRLCLAFVVIAGCGHPANPDHPTPTPTRAPIAGDPSCPVLVPGTSVAVEDTPTGAAFVFVTTGDVAEVRKRAATLAAMHAKHDGGATEMGMMISTAAAAEVNDLDKGARVTFTAKPADVGTLQSELRMHAQHLAGGTCEMKM